MSFVREREMNNSIIEEIREELLSQRDVEYRAFQQKVLPTIDPGTMIGVRTPVLRKMAKTYAKREEISEFLEALPHAYFDENQLHAFVISEDKDYGHCISELNRFLPYVDNWATCDQMSPKILKKHHDELLTPIDEWLSSGETYTIRFGIGALMEHFLEDDFSLEYPKRVSRIRSEEYYVNMMIAWYFATALAKQYEKVLPFLEKRTLDPWVHNKAIQKSVESYRITKEQKDYLRTLKVK